MSVEVLKNKFGYVYAYIEFNQFNKFTMPSNTGEFLYVHNIWIHPKFRRMEIIDKFIQIVIPKVWHAKYVYWVRSKYDERYSLYNIDRKTDKIKLKKIKITNSQKILTKRGVI